MHKKSSPYIQSWLFDKYPTYILLVSSDTTIDDGKCTFD